MGSVSDMMSFDDIADDDALRRRDDVMDGTGSISSMMGGFTNVAGDESDIRSSTGGGFMPGIEGEDLSFDKFAQTYAETDDTRHWRGREGLGSFSYPESGITRDKGVKIPTAQTLDMPYIDREKLIPRSKAKGMSAYQFGI